MASSGFPQEKPSKPEIAVKLLNPALLGLSSSSAVSGAGSSGSFTFGMPGMRQITVVLVTKLVEVDSQEKVQEFLGENGILPDVNATSLVYYLNPDLPSVREIGRGRVLQLPVLRIPRDGGERTLPRQPIVALLMDPTLKKGLRGDVDHFRSTVRRKKEKNFAAGVRNDLEVIDQALDPIYKDKLPSSYEMLMQVKGDVAALQAIFAKYHRKFNLLRAIVGKYPKLELGNKDSTQFDLIKTDLVSKNDAARRGNPDVIVMVRTLKDGEEISHFIVCYSPEAVYKEKCDLSFSQQSSPTEQPLAVAMYLFWAVRPGDGSPVSDIRRIPVRWQGGQFLAIDLTILK